MDGPGRWSSDECPAYASCTVEGKLERLTIGTRWSGGAQVPYIASRTMLIGQGWCTEATTHHVGDLVFGPDGYLYASAGDSARNGPTSPEQAEKCSYAVTTKYPSRMAALDVLDPSVKASLAGKIIRIEPRTGRGAPGNPYFFSRDANRARIIGFGFRNPYRMAFRPGSFDLTLTAIGEARTESVYIFNVWRALYRPVSSGWPCFEGKDVFETGPLCAGLSLTNGTVLTPVLSYQHGQKVTQAETCNPSGTNAVMGVAYPRRGMPAAAGRRPLVVNDYGRGCLWHLDQQGNPQFLADFGVHQVRALITGPDGYLYLAHYGKGAIERLVVRG